MSKIFSLRNIAASSFALATLATATPVFAAPSLQIISPTENQKVESDKITVSWKLTGFTLVDYANNPRNKFGQGHLHLWLDESAPSAANSTKITTGNSYTFENVKSGKHTLVVELQNNDHSSLKPPVKQTIHFETVAPVFVNPKLPQNDVTLFLILVAIVLVGGLWYFLSPESDPANSPAPTRNTKKSSATSKKRRK